MKSHCLSFVLLLLCLNASGQYYTDENRIWTFGYHSGLDFNSSPPAFFSTGDSTREGTATVSDSDGHLLFYTNGNAVYNRTGVVMPAGVSIVPFLASSSTQSSLIVPVITSPGRYYVFSVESRETGSGKLAYGLVDMSLDGGLGDIVPGSAGVILDDSLGEKIIAIRGENCNIWVVTHKRNRPEFRVYEINAGGISLLVSYYSGWTPPTQNYAIGVMKVSHDHRKIVMQGYEGHIELHDFNNLTGEISGCKILDSINRGGYGAEFSADNTKLYVNNGGMFSYNIHQYDLTDTSLVAIKASKTLVGRSLQFSDLKLAPDNKIYFMSDSVSPANTCTMGRIDAPDSAGAACGFVRSCIALSSAECGLGLPNIFVTPDPSSLDIGVISGPDTVCAGSTVALYNPTSGGAWSSGGTKTSVDVLGNVTGLVPGNDTITYTVILGPCRAIAKRPILVLGCDLDTIVVPPPLGAIQLSDIGQYSVSVFPNPSTGTFKLLVSANVSVQIPITITDLWGKTVKELIVNPNERTEIHLPVRGIYTLHTTTSGGARVTKVVVN